MPLMVITCGDCGARFHLDVGLLQGAKGGRIRCRKCGGMIVAQRPEVPAALPADAVAPIRPEVPATVYSSVEDLFAPPLPPEEVPAEVVPADETAVTEPERKVPSRRAPSRSTPLILFVLCLLLLAAAALYLGIPKPGDGILGKLFTGWGSSRTESAPAGSTYDIRNVKWSIEKETASGTLFVVTGEVANVGKGQSAGIGIRATLLGKDNQALAETTAFAGNVLDEASLRRMDRPAIEGAMSNRFGQGNVNREIPPGKALPFMVLFFDTQGEIDAVMVKADDAR